MGQKECQTETVRDRCQINSSRGGKILNAERPEIQEYLQHVGIIHVDSVFHTLTQNACLIYSMNIKIINKFKIHR